MSQSCRAIFNFNEKLWTKKLQGKGKTLIWLWKIGRILRPYFVLADLVHDFNFIIMPFKIIKFTMELFISSSLKSWITIYNRISTQFELEFSARPDKIIALLETLLNYWTAINSFTPKLTIDSKSLESHPLIWCVLTSQKNSQKIFARFLLERFLASSAHAFRGQPYSLPFRIHIPLNMCFIWKEANILFIVNASNLDHEFYFKSLHSIWFQIADVTVNILW